MKRFTDVVVSAVGLVALFPLLAAIALAVRCSIGSPVIFRHRRPGLHGRLFTLYKFRTMNDARDAQGRLLPDSRRVTPLGSWLRRTSLDELPELFNVLRGEMSLVGPRPLLIAFLEHYSPEQRRRHSLRPGITGWAQVRGRNELSWDQRLAMDLWYVDHVNWRLDLRILLMTFATVATRRGIEGSDKCLPPKLSGNYVPLE